MNVIIAAFISALITGIIGPLITLRIQRRNRYAELPSPSRERLNRLEGIWYGSFTQIVENKTTNFEVELFLKNQGKIIEGKANFTNSQKEKACLVMYDGVFDRDILKIEYKNKSPYIFQSGSVIAEMDPRGNELRGKFVGYSPSQKKIIAGEVYCTNNPRTQSDGDSYTNSLNERYT